MSDENLDDDEFQIPKPAESVYDDPDGVVSSSSERLEGDNRHPVLIFGSSRSGKSTFIISLLHGLARAGRRAGNVVDVNFGQSFYETRDARADAQMQMARNFYEASRVNFILGRRALDTTQGQVPFFVPLDLRIKGTGMPPVKIALLDGRGEWYEPNQPGADAAFKEFQSDIIDVLENYSRGVSVILIAPYSLGDSDRNDVKNCDSGLWKCLDRYAECRRSPEEDSMLLLLSKWDQASTPGEKGGNFVHLNGEDVAAILERRYQMTWDKFRTVDVGNDEWRRRSFMQYSSCSFVDGRPKIPEYLEEEYFRYPRTVANWIYENARLIRAESSSMAIDIPIYLFEDVVPEGAAAVPFSTRFLQAIVRG